jgi:hypothetical protein
VKTTAVKYKKEVVDKLYQTRYFIEKKYLKSLHCWIFAVRLGKTILK